MTNIPNRTDLISLARAGGEIAKSFFQIDVKAEWKGDKTPLTQADQDINDMVIDALSECEDLFVLGEEGTGGTKGARYSLLVDPIDGTFPFKTGTPNSAVVLCLFDGLVPIIGVIYDFMLDRMWSAQRGVGAWMNGEAITVSPNHNLEQSQVCAVWWHGCDYNMHQVVGEAMKDFAVFNPISIAYFGGILASGGIEATIFPGRNAWETGAMEVLVTESGGQATNIHGERIAYRWDGDNIVTDGHIMSNGGPVHSHLVNTVKNNN